MDKGNVANHYRKEKDNDLTHPLSKFLLFSPKSMSQSEVCLSSDFLGNNISLANKKPCRNAVDNDTKCHSNKILFLHEMSRSLLDINVYPGFPCPGSKIEQTTFYFVQYLLLRHIYNVGDKRLKIKYSHRPPPRPTG